MIRACLSGAGNFPGGRVKLTILVMRGSNSSRHSLKVSTGSGSKGQAEIAEDFIAFKTSSSETSVNSLKEVVHVWLSWTDTDDMVEVASLFWSFLIFSLKNVANELGKSLGLS